MLLEAIKRDWCRFNMQPSGVRSLLISFIACGIASPLQGLFTNAFVWRKQHDVIAIALYNGSCMAGIALAFIANGYVLRYVRLGWLYAIGLVLQSASSLVLFMSRSPDIGTLSVLGFGSGTIAGMYWANRNLLSLQVTSSHDRDYFCSLESAIGTFLAVLSPLACGWFLQLGTGSAEFGVFERYRILATAIIVVQLLGAIYIVKVGFDDYIPRAVFVRKASSLWNQARIFTACKGVADGAVAFIPVLLVLRLVGEEGAVGLTQSIATLFTSGVMYYVARLGTPKRRRVVLECGVWMILLGAGVLSLFFSTLGALVYLVLTTLAVQLLWAAAHPIVLDIIERDRAGSLDSYKYIVDRELFLNLGRLSGVFVVISLSFLCDPDVTLRLAPLILALATTFLLLVGRRLTQTT